MADSGSYTPETLARRQAIAEALLRDSSKPKPIRHWLEGAGQLAQSGLAGWELGQLDKQEREGDVAKSEAIAKYIEQQGGNALPQMPQQAPAAPEQMADTTVPLGSSRAAPDPAGGRDPASAIASIESGGRYDAQGPLITSGAMAGQRALGKYQVMESNVAPWTKAHLGREFTPDEFLKDPKAQDAVFQGEFGRLAAKHGPEGAARAWFAGEGGMNDLNRRDQLGTTVGNYGARFAQASATPPDQQGIIPTQPARNSREKIAAMLRDPSPYVRQAGQHIATALMAQDMKPDNYGFHTLPDGTVLRTDPRTGRATPIYQGDTKPTWGVIGETDGTKQYGFVDPFKKSVQVYQQPGATGAPATVTDANGKVLTVPQGQDPKKFREHVTTATADAMAGKSTEVQANATQFANRMEDAEKNLAGVEPDIAAGGFGVNVDRMLRGVTEGQYNPIPRGATNWGVSDKYQKFEQAKSQFVTALLRKESGAAISATEFDRYDKEFFPQMGDSADVIRQKQNARKVAIEAMKKAAGPVYRSPQGAGGNTTKNGVSWSVE